MRAFLFALLLAGATGLQAAEITVFSSSALKSVLEELVPQFEKSAGHKVSVQFAPAAELKARIDQREAFDVAILTAALMDDLAKESRIAGISRGIAEEMKAKTRLLSGVSAADAVAQGEAELGFTMISEILPVAGAELAGPLPPEVQVYTVFPAAMSSSAREPAAAYAFVRFLKTPEAARVIREKGMEPG